jgi:4-hydroxyproline epimerase
MHRIDIVDSHTAGEPTRVVLGGLPDLPVQPLADSVAWLRTHHDTIRRSVVLEPRGNDVIVGAYLCPPHHPDADFGVIFFNNVGYLGMCGHGTIGLITTLAHLGRIRTGTYTVDTPAGCVTAELHDDGSVSVANVPAFRLHHHVALTLPDGTMLHGDVAYGGNWFFLCHDHGRDLHTTPIAELTTLANAIKHQLTLQQITGTAGAAIDHIELFGTPLPGADSRSFVLCPGDAYDRSPCGTGTSAKLACLAADGLLAPGQSWVQESVIGSRFVATYQYSPEGHVLPTIRGRAHITLVGQLIFEAADPFQQGIVR